jgi:enoyl-CoA hydratase
MTNAPAAASPPAPAAPKVRIERRGALVNFILDRPKALNAFDDEMRRAVAEEIPRVARNPDVYIVALTSASPRAFCAGGDVRALVAAAKTDMPRVRSYFAAEYQLDWLLDCFSKPTVSLIDGLCMGSGAGLSSFNTHRVAGEGYAWAMPETAIGLFPDVGIAHVLARMPWPIGLYLGLTGRTLSRADAYWLGLATHCIDRVHFEHILTQLSDVQPVDPLLDGLHITQGRSPVQDEASLIRDFFSAETLAGIFTALASAKGAAKEWADQTLADLRARSPMSLAITFRHIRDARALDLRETLIQDFRLAWRCLDASDFTEGVRAALIDKDHAPHWMPSRFEDIDEAAVDQYFKPLGADDLPLLTREEMQAARV